MKSKIYFWAIIILLAVSVISGFYIWRFQSARGLDLKIEIPDEILSGVPFDVKINFSNNSGSILEDANFMLILSEGAAFFGSSQDKTVDTKTLGNIGAGSLVQEDYRIIMFGQEGEKKRLKAVLNYSPSALSARFEKNETADVELQSSGIEVELTAPENILSGEEFEINVIYRNLSDIDFSDLELTLEYPPSFTFLSSSLKPDKSNNVWLLGDLKKNSEGDFRVRGSIVGVKEEIIEFRSKLLMRSLGQAYIVHESIIEILITASPLSLAVHLNNDPNYIARPEDMLSYTISYVNGTDVALRNVTIRAQLIGEMFDTQTLQTQSIFRSSDNTLIWNSQNTPTLSVLQPGSAGIVDFNIKTKKEYPIRRFGDKNFMLRVNVEAESPTAPKSMNVSRIFSKVQLETKVSGMVAVDAMAYFRDAESGILNKGPLPPKAGQATNFTIHWLLKDFAADMSNIEVRAPLGDNVKMTGVSKNDVGSPPFIEDNKVVWKIDRLQANQGVVSSPLKAVFQIEAIPSGEQVGTYMTLMGDLFVKATDEWTGEGVANNDIKITTALPDDTTIGGQGGVVQP